MTGMLCSLWKPKANLIVFVCHDTTTHLIREMRQVVRGRISCSLDIAGGAGVNSDPQADGKKVSDLLLKRIQGTDRGLSATPEQKKEIDGLIEQVTLQF